MARQADDFERLVSGVFSPEQREEYNSFFGAFALKQIYPGREELLEHFDALLGFIVGHEDPNHIRGGIERFLGKISEISEFAPGMELKVDNAQSFITDLEDGCQGWGVLYDGADVFGSFGGIALGPWYDIPLGMEQPDDEAPYLRPWGLMVGLQSARVVHEGGEADILDGYTYVPLNHGAPELFQVIRP